MTKFVTKIKDVRYFKRNRTSTKKKKNLHHYRVINRTRDVKDTSTESASLPHNEVSAGLCVQRASFCCRAMTPESVNMDALYETACVCACVLHNEKKRKQVSRVCVMTSLDRRSLLLVLLVQNLLLHSYLKGELRTSKRLMGIILWKNSLVHTVGHSNDHYSIAICMCTNRTNAT